jgi:hypothetical protein
MIAHEFEHYRWIQKQGVGKKDIVASSRNSYVFYLNSVSRLIDGIISPTELSSGADVTRIVCQLQGRRKPKTIDNYRSAMRQYVAMVQAGWHLERKAG